MPLLERRQHGQGGDIGEPFLLRRVRGQGAGGGGVAGAGIFASAGCFVCHAEFLECGLDFGRQGDATGMAGLVVHDHGLLAGAVGVVHDQDGTELAD